MAVEGESGDRGARRADENMTRIQVSQSRGCPATSSTTAPSETTFVTATANSATLPLGSDKASRNRSLSPTRVRSRASHENDHSQVLADHHDSSRKPPAVPQIPHRFLIAGRSVSRVIPRQPATVLHDSPLSSPDRSRSTSRNTLASRPRHGISDTFVDPQKAQPQSRATPAPLRASSLPPRRNKTADSASKGLYSLTMAHYQEEGRGEDLFLELASDRDDGTSRPLSRFERSASRMLHGKHHSVPNADAMLSSPTERRPKSSGQTFAQSRLKLDTNGVSQRHDRESVAPEALEEPAGVAQHHFARHRQRHSAFIDRAMFSPAQAYDQAPSPVVTRMDNRRLSFGLPTRASTWANRKQESVDESPAESSEHKQSVADSASVDSQTAPSTVWDELDDLKSRIKKLELTGKLPTTSGAAVVDDQNERPRTATTAPTTIDSSPKHAKPAPEQAPSPTTNADNSISAAIHPLLHAALAKTRPLVSPQLYRILEATATDALQLAAMTGTQGPQRTPSTPAAIITGLSASERQARRKADSMCRNLTDLCLALCEGKQEIPSISASPVARSSPVTHSSPPRRYFRNSFGADGATSPAFERRPMSRLEARRSSILGLPTGGYLGIEKHPSSENLSETESHASNLPRRAPSMHYAPRASSLLRASHHGPVEEDEDVTLRPSSRAATEFGRLRQRATGPRDHYPANKLDSPRWHESARARLVNVDDGTRSLSRVPSLESHRARRYAESAVPTVAEATPGSGYGDERPRRVASISGGSAHNSRLTRQAELPFRALSLSQRRHLPVD